MALKAIVSDIQSLSAHDGPGLRTTVFFKGCSLQCVWCHNPETIRSGPELQWDATRCLGCRACESVCPVEAILFSGNGHYIINKQKCFDCGICAEICPSGALEMTGREYTVEGLFERILKDERFIMGAGGGVTFSGGEPLLRVSFLKELASKLKDRGFHLAIDTSGIVPGEALRELLPLIDLVLYDLKEINSEKHRHFTGTGNERVFGNLLLIKTIIRKERLITRVWIRTPVIPGMTDTEENIRAVGTLLSQEYIDVVERWELLGFNNMCHDKYRKLGKLWLLEETELLTVQQADHLLHTAREAARGLKKIIFSGLTRTEEA